MTKTETTTPAASLGRTTARAYGAQAADGSLAPLRIERRELGPNDLVQRRSFAGSAIGGMRETQEMLDFCAEHGIGAEIEVIPAGRINEAWERVLKSDVRYRFVIDNATL